MIRDHRINRWRAFRDGDVSPKRKTAHPSGTARGNQKFGLGLSQLRVNPYHSRGDPSRDNVHFRDFVTGNLVERESKVRHAPSNRRSECSSKCLAE